MPLVDDISENVVVRQAAVAVLVTWRPSSGWYQRLAANTWREPFHQMASFMTSVIESVSRSTDQHYHTQ